MTSAATAATAIGRKTFEKRCRKLPTSHSRAPTARRMTTADRMVTAAAMVMRCRSLNSIGMAGAPCGDGSSENEELGIRNQE